jgi:hypothetical protein
MKPSVFDLLRTYTDNEDLYKALDRAPDEELVFWLYEYGSRLARWRLCYELGKSQFTELARRAEFLVGRLNSGVTPGELFPVPASRNGGDL